ncbi:carboxypeptidase-like regulatory domain-containing protein [Thermaurantimonas aggregans]|uniref:carboxypeptidase-like regulatory domain-containing protein n=1 Tax=Thermaurantimonas aggregans TaxID=2173829 RepID=UPI00135B126A|nr:carboxypeptidase-like regulatory domain-containing protein [Thermaurantimonas aggregans]MCX8148134.1 carboxypeptidase-like regulatory domain-containing protein [Thermaurantimonas aggregans]
MFRLLLAAALCLSALVGFAQKGTKAIQISGVIVTDDDIPQFIPNTHVLIRSRGQGTISSSDGFFSIAAMPGDTILFSCIGFKREKFYVSPELKDEKGYLMTITLVRDTTMLQEVTLYPWPSRDRLYTELLAMRPQTTELDIAQRNLALESLKDRARAMGFDASEAARHVMRQQEQSIYNYNRYNGLANGGQAMLLQLSNPFAWLELFESLKKKK